MKTPFVNFNLYQEAYNIPQIQSDIPEDTGEKKNIIHTTSRSSTITAIFVGKAIAVHNGRKAVALVIKNNMIGSKLGEFIFTKKLGSSIHNSAHNRKKREKMRRKITQKKIRKTVSKTKTKKAKKTKK